MATTQESYRQGGRLPRYSTKLSAFSNGMYLTNQVIPEGYAKMMVNYDIDDTGSNITPRNGRKMQDLLFFETNKLGPVTMTDYIYALNETETEVESVKDIVLSLGEYTAISDVISDPSYSKYNKVYLSSLTEIVDDRVYTYNEETGEWVPNTTEGTVKEEKFDEFWAILFNKDTEKFEKITNEDIGFLSARTLTNAYAFDKCFSNDIGRPISTVMNNEIIAFAGPKLQYTKYLANSERNELSNFGNPGLCKLILYKKPKGGYAIKRKLIEPKPLNPLEASTFGYNILHPSPYKFRNESGGAISVLGMLAYESRDSEVPQLNPTIGKALNIRVYYQYPELSDDGKGVEVQVKVEAIDLSDNNDFEVLHDFDLKFTTPNDIWIEYTPKAKNSMVRVTLRKGSDTATEAPFLYQVDCDRTVAIEPKEYQLDKCKGMFSWQGCVGLYGVPGSLDTLFFSDIDDPSYFPFPYNVIYFDNEILAVHNYLDNLIVVTVDSVWLVAPGTTIDTSITKRVLSNLHIPEVDAINLVVLKDQIFFKTDTSFYVLKPNKYTSDSTDLKNYVNSISIANYTKEFTKNTVILLNEVYKKVWQGLTKEHRKQIRFEDFEVHDIRSIIKDDEVHYIYTITPILTDDIKLDNLNLHLVYNTISRSWRIYTVAIGGDDISYAPILYKNKQSGEFNEFFGNPYKNTDNRSVLCVAKQVYDRVTDAVWDESVYDTVHLTTHYNNYPYLDTGNVSIDDTFTKRFREVQFNLANMEKTQIEFSVDFKVDGLEQVQATHYDLQHIVDKEDPDYGKIFVTPLEYNNMSLPGVTALADTTLDEEYFRVDLSKFPDLNVITVRLGLQGRGRRGSIQLLNTSLEKYELSDMVWVYRIMNAR